MQWALLVLIAGIALLCPITMMGPMLLRRLGILKGEGAPDGACMGAMPSPDVPGESELSQLQRRRSEIEREIARLEKSRGTSRFERSG